MLKFGRGILIEMEMSLSVINTNSTVEEDFCLFCLRGKSIGFVFLEEKERNLHFQVSILGSEKCIM